MGIMNWTQLNSSAQISQIDTESHHNKVMIYKHSKTCSISASALNRLERNWKESDQNKVNPYFLDLLNFRNLSNEVASHYGVEHESPQVLIIEKGKCIYNASHYEIRYEDLMEVAIINGN